MNKMKNIKKEIFPAEPFRTKTIERIYLPSREERGKKIEEVHYNLFGLKSEDVYIDLLTDAGTAALSDTQWAALMRGDESYAGGKSFYRLKKAIRDVLGFKYVVPTHQGRAADNIFFGTVIKKGDIVPFNQPYDTSETHIIINGGEAVSCVGDIAYDASSMYPFKGNVDVGKLKSLIKKVGKDRIPLIMITITNNSGGGQPTSMANLKMVKDIADKYHIPLWFDAARCVENAYFIQKREEGYKDRSISDIIKEQFSYVDGCISSAKKDLMADIGGFIALNDEKLYDKMIPRLVTYEGFTTYGGQAGRDIECLAQSLYEMVDDAYVANRVRQVEYLWKQLDEIGVPVVKPVGGFAVFIDAKAMLPHIPQSQFPACVLANELYIESGVRGAGYGALVFSHKDEKTGEMIHPKQEYARLAVPRRVYTDRHMDVVAEGFRRVYSRRNKLKGLKIIYQPHGPIGLRHFTVRMEPAE